MTDQIGLKPAEDYFQQLCLSIIDDLENNNFSWYGNEHGVMLTINGQTKFIQNDSDEEEEIRELWNTAKKMPEEKDDNRSTLESNDSKKS